MKKMQSKLKQFWSLLILTTMMVLVGCSSQTKSLESQQLKPIVACQRIDPSQFPVVPEVDRAKLDALRSDQANAKKLYYSAIQSHDDKSALMALQNLDNADRKLLSFMQDIYFKVSTTYSAGAYTYKALVIKANGLQECLSDLDKKGLIIYTGK